MECLPKNTILKFHPDTLQDVRKIYGLDGPGRMKEAVDVLDRWVKKQTHFTKKDFSREYLERIIITTKGSLERAKVRLDKVCTLRTLMPQYFGDYDVRNYFKDLYYKIFVHAALPKLTKDNYRVFMLKNFPNQYNSKMFQDYYRAFIIFSEYLRAHDYATGVIFVTDYRDLNILDYVTKMNPMELRQLLALLMEGYGIRVKGIHIITSSKMIETLITVFKQVLSAKLGERIQVHTSVETLHGFLPKEILPVEYGGEEKSLKDLHDDWVDVLSSKEHTEYQKKMNRARTDESLRQTDTFNAQYMGMPGSFRTLSVD